jgi:hypothetical protein
VGSGGEGGGEWWGGGGMVECGVMWGGEGCSGEWKKKKLNKGEKQ